VRPLEPAAIVTALQAVTRHSARSVVTVVVVTPAVPILVTIHAVCALAAVILGTPVYPVLEYNTRLINDVLKFGEVLHASEVRFNGRHLGE